MDLNLRKNLLKQSLIGFALVTLGCFVFFLGCGGGSSSPAGPDLPDLSPDEQKLIGTWIMVAHSFLDKKETKPVVPSPNGAVNSITFNSDKTFDAIRYDGINYVAEDYYTLKDGTQNFTHGKWWISNGLLSLYTAEVGESVLSYSVGKNSFKMFFPEDDSLYDEYAKSTVNKPDPSDPLRGSTPAPGTDVLGNTVGRVLTYPQNAGYSNFLSSITFEIPTPTRQERYGLVLANVANNTESRSVTVAPLSYVAASSRAASLVTAGPDAPTLGQRQPNQIWAEQEMRRRRSLPPAMNAAGPLPQAAVRAANNSGEQLFAEVTFNLYSRSVFGIGSDYTQRTCVLRRIGQFCKIFVDKNPSPSRGLSAVPGTTANPNAITDAELDQLVRDFDTVAWPILRDGYGPTWDVDQDGKVTFVFSPLYTELGFAGLFDTAHLEPSHPQTNQRDMVVIFTPDVSGQAGSTWDHERWLPAARETMVHECQHIINYSAHKHFKDTGFEEAVWLDEALSVGVEARFRISRGDPAGEDRFNSWASGRPNSYALTDFSWDVAKYGMLGLWGHYLFEQGGTESVRLLVQGNVQGKNNIDARFAARGGMEGLFPDWAAAVFSEGMRRQGLVNYGALDDRHKFKANLDLNLAFTSVPFGSSATTSVRNYGASFLYLTPPSGYNQNSFRFVVYAPDTPGLRCVLMRLQ